MHRFSALLLTTLLASPAPAQEVSVALGSLHDIGGVESTYSWQLQYLHPIGESFGASLSWWNEGHLVDHHRDGMTMQAWAFHRMKTNSLRLGVGIGTHRFFDTTSDTDGTYYRNDHGLKSLLSLQARYPAPSGAWAGFFQLNRTIGDSPQTRAVLIGVSASFGGKRLRRAVAPERSRSEASILEGPNEISFLFGRTILNSFSSETTDFLESFALDYRRQLGKHLDATVSYCDEGGIDTAKRDGIALQLWVTARSPRHPWMISFGLGPYLARVYPSAASNASTITVRSSPRYSILVGRHLGGHWDARLQWNRTLTNYHRDTDVLLTGLAYRW